MPTFDNVINLSGSAMAISYENKFLGENFANYSRIKKLTLKGHVDSRSANTDFSGVKESLTSYKQIFESAHDHTSSQFIINGRSYGNGRILSIDFSEKNNPIRMGSFTADIEIYESGNIFDEVDGNALYPNLKTTLDSHQMNFLDSMSESFSFNGQEDDSYNYSHSLDFKYISGQSGTDYVSLAKTLANSILESNNQPNLPFGEYAGLYDEALYKASKHKYNESYDLVDLSFSFSKDLNFLPNGAATYSTTETRSLVRSAEGFIDVSEDGQVKSRTNDFAQAELGLSSTTGAAYARCNLMATNFGLLDGSTAAGALSTQYTAFGKTINRQQNTIDYNLTYTNNPRISRSGIHEYSQSVSEDFSNGVLSVSENGTYRPYGIKSTTFNETTAIKAIINNSANSRITTLISNYLSSYSETTSINSADKIKRTNYSIEYPKHGQTISYSCDYSIDGKFLSPTDTAAYGLHSVEMSSSDSSPKIMRKSFMIPGQGELLQEGYQTEVGTRSISVSAQKTRTANYISSPPDLQVQLDYLYQVAIEEMLKIPMHYPNNIIKEVWISSCSFDFASANGQISVDLQASFTMVGVDYMGNTASHAITKRTPGNYTSL